MKVYPSTPKRKVYPPTNTNHMVLWVRPGYKAQIIDEMYNKSKELCWNFVHEHKHDSDYAGGKLISVAVKYQSKTKK